MSEWGSNIRIKNAFFSTVERIVQSICDEYIVFPSRHALHARISEIAPAVAKVIAHELDVNFVCVQYTQDDDILEFHFNTPGIVTQAWRTSMSDILDRITVYANNKYSNHKLTEEDACPVI